MAAFICSSCTQHVPYCSNVLQMFVCLSDFVETGVKRTPLYKEYKVSFFFHNSVESRILLRRFHFSQPCYIQMHSKHTPLQYYKYLVCNADEKKVLQKKGVLK